ncbi:predicted transcriptional regulator [Pelotomaculum thermopropionicum SI]|uniref:Predicted transcriptional regulator n=1 Tax=Pelotomaculum thermopropionicum (strain DSM 13744 / JCM 10971 / SI) TaxID=370438 RepID=A5D0S5_PELTS|nr:predicted transcriptional regulator [Pelotomaculum thermopropionicum SI]
MTKLSRLLKQLRGDEPLRDAAERAGISHTYLSQLEKGIDPRTGKEIRPSPETLKGISKAYNYPYEKLLAVAGYLEETGKSAISDPSTPSLWYRDTPPTKIELEVFLKNANVYFDGAPLNEEDKEDILDYLAWKWEREKKKRDKQKGGS